MENKIKEYLLSLNNPYTETKLTDEVIEEIKYVESEQKAYLQIKMLGADDGKNKNFQRQIIKYLKVDLGIKFVKFTYIELPDSEETEADGKNSKPQSLINPKTKVIAFMSGKGGVGKSQVTASVARYLTRVGKKVGIIDSDIYGYSIPKIFDHYEVPKVKEGKIIPPLSSEGIELISSQYFIENNENRALVWRGPMLVQLMQHFIYDVKWSDDLDYILIDMPPGTGDVILNLEQLFDELYTYVVTTPSENASHVAIRAGEVGKSFDFKNLGVIENMSWYKVKDEKHLIFGDGGGMIVANELETDLIAQIPLGENDPDIERAYLEIVNNIIEKAV